MSFHGSPFDVDAGLSGVALDPSNAFAYVVDTNAGAVDGYRIAQGSGVLARLPGMPVTIGGAPLTIAVDPLGRFVYAGESKSLYVFSLDPASGALTPVDHSPFAVGGTAAYVAPEPSGHFVYVSQAGPPGIQAFSVDSAGALTKVAGSPFGTASVHAGALVFHPNGRFVYGASGLVSGFAIDPDSGALSALAGSPLSGGGSDPMAIDLAIEPGGRFAYAVTTSTGALNAYAIDADGALTTISDAAIDANSSPYSVAVDPDGRFVYVGNDDVDETSVFAIDPSSGTLTATAHSPFSPAGLEPEMIVARLLSR